MNIKEFFINSKQLEKYENNTLSENDIVILSNNNKTDRIDGKISIDMDKFNSAKVIIKNSILNNIEFIGYKTLKSKLEILNTTMGNCEIYLGKDSSVKIENCITKNISLNATNIDLNKIQIIGVDSYLFLGTKSTENISIDNVNSNSENYVCLVSAKNIEIENSKSQLSCYFDRCLYINNCDLIIESLIGNSSDLVIEKSKLLSKSFSKIIIGSLKIIKDSTIEKCNMFCNNIIVYKNQKLQINNSAVQTDFILLKDNSELINTSPIIAQNFNPRIYLNENSKIDFDFIKFKNNESKNVEFQSKLLANEREKFVKTLKLIENKYNKPLKELVR